MVLSDWATAVATAATTAVARKVNLGKIFIRSATAHCRAATAATGVAIKVQQQATT